MEKLNDQYYINLILGGDTNAFSILVERYQNMVFTLSLKMLQHREEAEETSQDTFIKAYKSLSKFRSESKFSTWLYKITYNNCLDKLKNKKREVTFTTDDVEKLDVTGLLNVLDMIEERERKQKIEDCLAQLAPEENFLLSLYYLHENSLKEISQIMGINENNLKIKLFRSRKKLAGIFKTELEPQLINQYENQR